MGTQGVERTAPEVAPFVRDGVGFIPLWGASGRARTADRRVVAWALVDEADFSQVAPHRWHLSDTGYACRWIGGRKGRERIRMHRLLLEEVDFTEQVDHVNRDKLDNRRGNLRRSSDALNRQNVPARGGSSRYRGVSYDRERGKWMAQAKCGELHWRRRFNTEEEANVAVQAWRAAHMPHAME